MMPAWRNLADAQDLNPTGLNFVPVRFGQQTNMGEQFLTVPDFALYGRICSVGLYQDIEILS